MENVENPCGKPLSLWGQRGLRMNTTRIFDVEKSAAVGRRSEPAGRSRQALSHVQARARRDAGRRAHHLAETAKCHTCGLSSIFSKAHVLGKNKFHLIPSSADDETLRGSRTKSEAFPLFRQADGRPDQGRPFSLSGGNRAQRTLRGRCEDKQKPLFCARIMIYYWGVYGRAG